MTLRTKRRLAVLVLALGLVAAAPYGFRASMSNIQPTFEFGAFPWAIAGGAWGDGRTVVAELVLGPSRMTFISTPPQRAYFGVDGVGWDLPPESITLRVACAVALAGMWGLVVGGRLLARRWQRIDTN